MNAQSVCLHRWLAGSFSRRLDDPSESAREALMHISSGWRKEKTIRVVVQTALETVGQHGQVAHEFQAGQVAGLRTSSLTA